MKKYLNNVENVLCAIGLFVMMAITVINALSRKFLGLSMSFLEEVTIAMFILISLFGAAEVAREGGHMGLDLITNHLPKKLRKYVLLITWICATAFCYFLTVYGFQMVQSEIRHNVRTAALGWPEWWFGAILPVSGILIFIRYTQWIIGVFKQDKEDEQCQ